MGLKAYRLLNIGNEVSGTTPVVIRSKDKEIKLPKGAEIKSIKNDGDKVIIFIGTRTKKSLTKSTQ
jgi:hypothetical protein